MTFRKRLFSFVLALLIAVSATAQDATYKITRKGLIKSVENTDGTKEEYNIISPILVFKSKYELSTEDWDSKFSVRHATLGLKGTASKVFSYCFHVDFCTENKITVLDLFATIKPIERLSFTVGQQYHPLFNTWTVAPNAVDYVNRPFLGKYFLANRDIGVSAKYALKQNGFPISLEFGVFNGSGMSNPVWRKSLATGGRIEFGTVKEGFRASAKYYSLKNAENKRELYWGADLRYAADDFKIEAECLTKNMDEQTLTATYLQGLYRIHSNSKALKRVEPLLRWDVMGYDIIDRGAGANRLTAGFNFVMNTALTSILRINYEQYFNNSMDMSALFKDPHYNQNKLSLEYLLFF